MSGAYVLQTRLRHDIIQESIAWSMSKWRSLGLKIFGIKIICFIVNPSLSKILFVVVQRKDHLIFIVIFALIGVFLSYSASLPRHNLQPVPPLPLINDVICMWATPYCCGDCYEWMESHKSVLSQEKVYTVYFFLGLYVQYTAERLRALFPRSCTGSFCRLPAESERSAGN